MTNKTARYIQSLEAFGFAIEKIEGDFFSSYDEIGGEDRNSLLLYIPWMTLASFQAELALKHLVWKSNLDVEFTHELEKLFNDLPENTKADIIASLSGWNFHLELKTISSLFVKSRYLEEITIKPYFLKDFRDCLVALARNSDEKMLKVHRYIRGKWVELD